MSLFNESEHITGLFAKELTVGLTAQEKLTLEDWKRGHEREAENIAKMLTKEQLPFLLEKLDTADRYMRSRLAAANVPLQEIQYKGAAAPVHRVHFLRTAWFRYAAAVILFLGMGGYLLWRKSGEIPSSGGNDKASVVRTQPSDNNKAILTLASGKKIELTDKAQGRLVQADGVEVSTPRGSQYYIILPDGTKVWLNAVSSIKFPSAFTGKERKVEVTGEVYLEVSPDKTHPFFVSTKDMEVQVLGTSFNINAYADEDAVRTTLVSGSVKVIRLQRGLVLLPGQQAMVSEADKIAVQKIDIDQVLAWKNGLFSFEGLGIREVMNQLQRWYDIEVAYEGPLPTTTFLGEMGKDVELPVVLEALSRGAGIHFRMKGKKLIVSQ